MVTVQRHTVDLLLADL